ncbi:MAG: hypothetical protein JSU06_00455 [Actinobacteria bacterium]|nr:hypothetical protein [Actinomycetota bacterium]
MSTTEKTTPAERFIYRATHRGSPEVLGLGVPAVLRSRLENDRVALADVALYTSTAGPLDGLVAVDTAEVLRDVAPLRNPLRTQAERDAEQRRVNELEDGDVPAVRLELVRAADAAHAAYPRYRHHWDRWFLGRMEEAHETKGTEIHEGDLVLYTPTPDDPHGSPVTVYAIRAGVDVGLPAEMGEAVARVSEAGPAVEAATGSVCVENVSIDGVVIGSSMRIDEESFVATAYPTTPGAEYTIGGRDSRDEAVAAVVAEWEAGWRSC